MKVQWRKRIRLRYLFASPKSLPDDKKVERWKDLWFVDVSIDGDNSK
jgi:hypothetical protein